MSSEDRLESLLCSEDRLESLLCSASPGARHRCPIQQSIYQSCLPDVSPHRYKLKRDPVEVLEGDPDLVNRAQAMDVPFEPVSPEGGDD